MLVSRNSMKAAIATTTAISQGLVLGRHGSAATGGAVPVPPELSVCESIELSALSCVNACRLRRSHQLAGCADFSRVARGPNRRQGQRCNRKRHWQVAHNY